MHQQDNIIVTRCGLVELIVCLARAMAYLIRELQDLKVRDQACAICYNETTES